MANPFTFNGTEYHVATQINTTFWTTGYFIANAPLAHRGNKKDMIKLLQTHYGHTHAEAVFRVKLASNAESEVIETPRAEVVAKPLEYSGIPKRPLSAVR